MPKNYQMRRRLANVVMLAERRQHHLCPVCRKPILKGDLYLSLNPRKDAMMEHYHCYMERLAGYAVVEGRACFWPRRED